MTEQEYYERIKAEYEASTDLKLVEWARPYFEGTKKPDGKDTFVICPVSDRAARDIAELTGSEVNGFNHVLRCDEVSHVNKRHGKKGKADRSMQNIEDLGRLAYVLDNYDEIIVNDEPSGFFLNKHGEHAQSILFVKRINGYICIAEAVSDSPKKKALHLQSAYRAKTSAFLAQKRESTIGGIIPRPNVQNGIDSSLSSILPQSDKNVNSSGENNPDIAAKPPSFHEIAEQYKDYRPPQKPRNSVKNNGKTPNGRGNSGR